MKLLTSLPTRLLAGAVVGTVLALSISSGTVLSLLTQATIYAVFALGVGLLLRQNGMVSFGHALYFGSAGYGVGLLLQQQAMPAELALLLTLLGLGLVAFLIGLVIVRVPGVAFGMLTLAIGQVFYLSASRSRGLTGGADGMNIDWPARLFGVELSLLLQPKGLFLLSWGVLLLVMVGGYKALWGPALGAVVYFLAKDVLGDYANHWMAIFGIALITVIVFAPTGLAGALGQLLRPRAPKPARRPAPAAH